MFIRKNSLFVGVLLLCIIGAGGLCLTASAGESEGKKGKVEITWLHPPKYFSGNDFSEGRAWVQEEKGGPWSLLDDQGNVLKTGLKAANVSPYKDGIASFWLHLSSDGFNDPSGHSFLNRSGDVVLPPGRYGHYREGLVGRSDKDGLVGFIDLSGKWVIPPAYDDTYFFSEGLASVQKGGKWGFIDKTGAVVIDFKFDDAYFFSHKMAPVWLDSKWGVIDPTGRWIAEPIYDGIGEFEWSELIALNKDGKVGFINSKGDVVIDFQYLPAEEEEFPPVYCFIRGRAIVVADDSGGRKEYGIIDESGKILLRRKNCTFFLAGDYVLCENANGQLSVIDRENKEYDLPGDVRFFNEWVGPNEKSPYPFRATRDGKIGYFTISIKND